MKEKRRRSPFAKEKMSFEELFLKLSITLLIAVVFIVCFLSFDGLKVFEKANYVDDFAGYVFQAHTIDVENGDAFILKLPKNKTLLIDCGDSEYEERVVSYIKQYLAKENLSQIDYFVMTHSDSDHIGNASAIIENFNVINVYRPKKYSQDEGQFIPLEKDYQIDAGVDYNKAIISAYQNDCNLIFSERGLKISLENCSIEFLSPMLDSYSDDNNYSAVLMIKYYSLKMLFVGDAGESIEGKLIDEYGDGLKADILKVGHHGSKTSTSEEFLQMVSPTYALLSCSENSSTLPNSEVISRIENSGAKLLSTMKMGSFAFTIEGNSIVYIGEKGYFNFWALIFAILLICVVVLFKIPFSTKKEAKKV